MSIVKSEKKVIADIQELIERNAERFSGIRSLRMSALEKFQQIGLPGGKHEEYRHTPLTRVLEKNFGTDAISGDTKNATDFSTYFIPGLSENRIVFINGIFSAEHSSVEQQDTVLIKRIEEVADKEPSLLVHLGKHADHTNDAFTAWNTAAWNYGVFIMVPDNTKLTKPLAVYNFTDASRKQIINTSRNLVHIGKGSEATIILKSNSTGNNAHFTNTVTEVVVNENAGIDLYMIQNDQTNAFEFNHTTVFQSNHSRVNCFTFTLEGKLIRNNLQLLLDGEGCDSHMYGLYLLNGDTLADNHTVADHRKPNSFSNELYKGIMNGKSTGVFNGKIYVRPHAQKTNAFQANRNIILTDEAGVNTKPQLEIWADDVKCSHGCTSGQLDEEALFYLQTRGIQMDTAKAMLLYAFAEEVVTKVKLPAVKDYLDKAIGERLNKNFEA